MELKVKSLLLAGALVCSLGFMTSCSSSDDSSDAGGGGNADPANVVPYQKGDPDNMQFLAFTGIVTDEWGSTLSNVKVTNGVSTARTDENGIFTFKSVAAEKNRAVMKFELEGYNTIVRAFAIDGATRVSVCMVRQNGSATTQASFSKDQPGDITAGSSVSVQVEIPANSVVLADGTPYTGTNVNASVTYLNPDEDYFAEAMPGDLTAIGLGGEEQALISFGMVDVDLTGDNGEKLQLANDDDEKIATLTFDIPESLKAKYQGKELPQYIPLWSFNEKTGLWEQEKYQAELIGDKYVGKVEHFSWHNLDWPEYRAELEIKVVDTKGKPLPWIKVDIDGQRVAFTNNNGIAKCIVPNNTDLYVRVPSEAYGDYSPEVRLDNINLQAQSKKTVTLTLPAAPVLKGCVINTGTGNRICSVYLSYGEKTTAATSSDIFGAFNLVLPIGYKGVAVLHVTTAAGEEVSKNLELTSEDQYVEVTIRTENDIVGDGQLIFTNEKGESVKYSTPSVNAEIDQSGITIIDKYLECNLMKISKNGGMEQLSLSIDNYNPATTRYDKVAAHFAQEGQTWMQVQMSVTVDVTKNGDVFTFKIVSGNGSVNTGNWDEQTKVTVTGEFTAPLYLIAHSVSETTNTSGLPSFVPFVSGKAFDALILDNSKYIADNGATILYYDNSLTEADFNAMIAKAKKTFGEPYAQNDNNTTWLWADFYKDGKFMEITFNPNDVQKRGANYSLDNFTYRNFTSKITIRAFNNYKIALPN